MNPHLIEVLTMLRIYRPIDFIVQSVGKHIKMKWPFVPRVLNASSLFSKNFIKITKLTNSVSNNNY